MVSNVIRGDRSTATAREIAHSWLMDAITSLPWNEEAFLNEVEIAEASGTSRTPVREAMLSLEMAGLIRRVKNKGAYVPAMTTTDITQMMEARGVIEEWAVAKAAGGRLDVSGLRELVETQREDMPDPLRFIDDDVAFHMLIVDAGRNPALSQVYRSLRHKQLRLGVKAVQDSSGRSDHVLDEHALIIDGIASGDPDRAVHAMREHLAKTLHALTSDQSPH